MMNTNITVRGDITITERPASNERELTRLRLDASRATETGNASVALEVSVTETGFKVRRMQNRGAGWSRAKVSYHATEALAIAAAREAFERQLRWLAGVTPVAGRPIDIVNL